MIKPLFLALFACAISLPASAGDAAPAFTRKTVARIEDGETVVEFAKTAPAGRCAAWPVTPGVSWR